VACAVCNEQAALHTMGFGDAERNAHLLRMHAGSVEAVVRALSL